MASLPDSTRDPREWARAPRIARRARLFAICLALCASVAGCSAVGSAASYVWDNVTPGIQIREIEIAADVDANHNSPVAIDLVVAFEPGLLERLQTVSAEQWFADRAQYLRDEPQAFAVKRLEIVPGQKTVEPLDDDIRFKAEGGYLFIHYPPPGDHRLRIGELKELSIRLMESRYLVGNTAESLVEDIFK